MRKNLILGIILISLTILTTQVNAQVAPEPTQPAVAPIATPEVTMPPIAINYEAIWNLDTRKISKAPSTDITLLSAFDRVLLGNFKIAFPTKDNNESIIIGGPALGIDWFKLISKQTAITVEKNFKLRTSLGVLADVFHLEGLTLPDLKKILNISVGLGFAF